MTTVERYKACVVKNASQRFSITILEAERIMHDSGIGELIDERPYMSMHFAPEDWEENFEAYMKRNRN